MGSLRRLAPGLAPAPTSRARESDGIRIIQSFQQECLDHFVVLGEKHLNHLVKEYVGHSSIERPHRALEKPPLSVDPPNATSSPVICMERLGGLLKHYYRQVA